ncbi:protein unc-13 homolog 4B-like [Dermacentor variabilis]|uniref:protein unc-13 homolog 4B-like n=1 Tax=Dermacentor variabilis TaxID=34621 RepID=UPI003F5C74DB
MVPSGSSSPAEIYEGIPDPAQELERLFDPISQRDFLRLCVQCLHMAERGVGKPTKPYGAVNEQLRSYVNTTFAEVMQVSGEDKIARLASKLPEVDVHLLVTVVQAEGLVARDVSGKSDPYCALRVGGSDAQLTSVKNRTVCPMWDERFRIRVSDPGSDAFQLAVWDKDPRTLCGVFRELRDVRSCFSCLHFLREMFETVCSFDGADDFMGAASIFVNEVPCTGCEQWLRLADAGGRGAYGRVYVRLGFECKTAKRFDRQTVLRYHYYLCLIFLLQHASTAAEGLPLTWVQWEQCITEEGLTLLFRHSQYHNLSSLEQQLCQIMALANVFRSKKVRLNFAALYQLLAQIRTSIKETQEQLIVNSLEVVVKALTDPCLERLARLHENFTFAKKYHRIDLLGLLFCCVTIEALVETEVTDPAGVEIRKDALAWYQGLLTQEDLRDEDSLTNIVTRILSTIEAYHQEADRIFKSAWNETYTQIVFKELDAFICQAFETRVRNFSTSLEDKPADDVSRSKAVEESLRLFYAFQRFRKEVSSALVSSSYPMRMDELQDWFGFDLVLRWFDLARIPVSGWISDLVDKDDMSPLARDVKYGSAVRDTIDILHSRYVELWRKLDLRDFRCVRAFSMAMAEECSHFVRVLSSRVESAGYFDVIGEFEVSSQLCVAVSSFARIASFLQETITEVDFVCLNDCDDIAERAGEARFPLERALDTSLIAMARVCSEAVDKLGPELRKRMSWVCDASSRHLQDRALHDLVQYVDACIGALHDHLDDIAFRKMLRLLWRSSVSSIREHASLIQDNYLYRFTTASLSFVGLHRALFQLKDVFHAGGAGLSLAELNVKPYADLDEKLNELVRALEEHNADLCKNGGAVIV